MRVEFWLMRVLLHPGPMRRPVTLANIPDPRTLAQAMAHVERGELACLPDGCIAEPVEVFASEMAAHAARERLLRDKPASDFRVVLSHALDSGEVA